MKTEQPILITSTTAAADLSNKKNLFIGFDGNVCGNGAKALGVLNANTNLGNQDLWVGEVVFGSLGANQGYYRTLFSSAFDSSKVLNCNFWLHDTNHIPFFVRTYVDGSYLYLSLRNVILFRLPILLLTTVIIFIFTLIFLNTLNCLNYFDKILLLSHT